METEKIMTGDEYRKMMSIRMDKAKERGDILDYELAKENIEESLKRKPGSKTYWGDGTCITW